MIFGIILIHGYSGSYHDLKPLADELESTFGKGSVNNLSLPGHDSGKIPEFDENLFIDTINQSIKTFKDENRTIIMIGHSTGGNLALATISKFSIQPELLILVSTPQKIDRSFVESWDLHRTGKAAIPLVDVGLMIKLINSTGSKRLKAEIPALIIHGENDGLVPNAQSQAWKTEVFSHPTRVVSIPLADHDIFKDLNSHLVIDVISRAITDVALINQKDMETINSLVEIEPNLKDLFTVTPFSESHLASCPGAQRIVGKKPGLHPTTKNDPVIANIEITTYCNLKCRFCARSQLTKINKHMSLDLFQKILALLPNIYKIVLVGLGEPLLHPQIIDLIKYAKSLRKKVGLVTNAMLLNPSVSKQLLDAGLDSIAFSLDGSDMKLSSLVRKGTNFNKVIKNIKEFVAISNTTQRISKAVFSAVSNDTVNHLKDLIDRVAELGVDVLMLTDLNFKANLDHTLWKNMSGNIEEDIRKAISYAFSKNLPVLSVHGLEEFGLEKRYHDFLLIPPGQLYQRSNHHAWCLSPWQTVPIDVEGNITLCDCQPDFIIGNLFQNSFSDIWNGEVIQKYRTAMLSNDPPEACRICPRF